MTARETKKKPVHHEDITGENSKILVLHNDDIHTFDYVIRALIEICGHDFVQASQCAIITHYKGKCEIKQGVLPNLSAMKEALTGKELITTIE